MSISRQTLPWIPKPTNVGAVSGLERVVHAIHFLLVPNEVLYRRNHALLLDSPNRQCPADSLENRIGPESFPAATTEGLAAERPDRRSEIDIGALALELLTQRYSTGVHQLLVPGRPGRDTGGERRSMIGRCYSESRILEAELRETKPESTAGISNTRPYSSSAHVHERYSSPTYPCTCPRRQ